LRRDDRRTSDQRHLRCLVRGCRDRDDGGRQAGRQSDPGARRTAQSAGGPQRGPNQEGKGRHAMIEERLGQTLDHSALHDHAPGARDQPWKYLVELQEDRVVGQGLDAQEQCCGGVSRNEPD
jgi:hypothetical protein